MNKVRVVVVVVTLFLSGIGFTARGSGGTTTWSDPYGVIHLDGSARQRAESAENIEHDVWADVELYTTSWCSYCRRAREFLRAHGVAFTEYDIEKDRDAAMRKRDLSGWSGVPVAVINGQVIRGFSKNMYQQALKQFVR